MLFSGLKFVTKGSKAHQEVEEDKTLKRRKLQLQVEYLELQNYKMKLEVMELEKKLMITPSKFTESLKLCIVEPENDGENIVFIDESHFLVNDNTTL